MSPSPQRSTSPNRNSVAFDLNLLGCLANNLSVLSLVTWLKSFEVIQIYFIVNLNLLCYYKKMFWQKVLIDLRLFDLFKVPSYFISELCCVAKVSQRD